MHKDVYMCVCIHSHMCVHLHISLCVRTHACTYKKHTRNKKRRVHKRNIPLQRCLIFGLQNYTSIAVEQTQKEKEGREKIINFDLFCRTIMIRRNLWFTLFFHAFFHHNVSTLFFHHVLFTLFFVTTFGNVFCRRNVVTYLAVPQCLILGVQKCTSDKEKLDDSRQRIRSFA